MTSVNPTGAVVLNSGGMDSFFVAMLAPAGPHVFVDIGQRYRDKERRAAEAVANHFGKDLHCIRGAQIAAFEHEPSGIIPLRNAELFLCAGQYGNDLFTGILNNEINSDKSPEFLRAMETVMDISCRAQYWSEGRTFKIHTPLGRRTKTQLVRSLYQLLDGDTSHPHWTTMMATVSCYSGTEMHCGVCPSCFKRWVALTGATRKDYGEHFLVHPRKWRPLSYWESRNYPAKRLAEIQKAFAVV